VELNDVVPQVVDAARGVASKTTRNTEAGFVVIVAARGGRSDGEVGSIPE
jgi:hypothetical protein